MSATATSDDESPSPDRICYVQNNLSDSKRPEKRKWSNSNEQQTLSQSSQSDSGSQSSSSSDSDSESQSSPTHAKKPRTEQNDKAAASEQTEKAPEYLPYVNNRAQEMMKRMGYRSGTGLGKHEQGRVAPVEASNQRGRRGLGLKISGFGPGEIVDWDPNLEEIKIEEDLLWLKSEDNTVIDYFEMRKWMVKGPRKEKIEDETNFVDAEVLENILKSKSIFDHLEPEELRRARTRSNPFETIRGAIFLNRAAVKMANMDARTGFMFTEPITSDGQPAVKPGKLLYFADVCAGPGGFSEYVLWRKKWFAKGFGFTLKGENDFKLSEFLAGSPESFQTYYGCMENGDVFDPLNISSLKEHILDQTGSFGVHFMMADGGFSVDGKENIQEILSKQLYLCQCLVALSIVREDGHFVVKLFDLFTKFSMGLMYLMYKSFKEVCIMKPNTSRPANSERYLICKWRCANVADVEKYLYYVNSIISRTPTIIGNVEDINEIVPMRIMQEDEQFMNYFIESNNSLGRKQIIGLLKIQAFCQQPRLVEVRQNAIRRQCLQAWKVDDRIRSRNPTINSFTVVEELDELLSKKTEFRIDSRLLTNAGNAIETIEDFRNQIGDCPYERVFMALAKGKLGEDSTLGFYLGVKGTHIYRYQNQGWSPVANPSNITLPSGTLIYGEMALEYRNESRAQTSFTVLHIVDALFLGKEPVYRECLMERIKLCELFTTAISQPGKKLVRMKQHMKLEQFHELKELDVRIMKNGHSAMAVILPHDGEEELFYVPSGFIFFNCIASPWHIHISKNSKQIYYYNSKTKESTYEKPPQIYGNFFSSFFNRSIWNFESSIMSLHENNADISRTQLHSYDIMKFLGPHLSK